MQRRAPAPWTMLAWFVAAAALPGCRLIDQRSFERADAAPRPGQIADADFANRASRPAPLVTIRFGTLDQSWRGPLIIASRAAQARKGDVQFDLVAPIPLAAPLGMQDQAAREGAADAASVALALQQDGVSADSIHIGSRGDAGDPPRQIEVYVR